jgi:hypothetical protein
VTRDTDADPVPVRSTRQAKSQGHSPSFKLGSTLTPSLGTLVFIEVSIELLLRVLPGFIRGIWVHGGAARSSSVFLLFFLLVRGRTLCIPSLHPAGGCRAGARGFEVCFAFGLRLGCGFGFGFGFGAWFSNFVCRWGGCSDGRVYGSTELGVLI